MQLQMELRSGNPTHGNMSRALSTSRTMMQIKNSIMVMGDFAERVAVWNKMPRSQLNTRINAHQSDDQKQQLIVLRQYTESTPSIVLRRQSENRIHTSSCSI